MGLLRFLETLRTPFFDGFFSLITHLGEEIFFMAIAIVLFWCVNKRAGLYVLITCFVGTFVNQTLKLIFRVSRPWVLDPEFTIVESAREQAIGYSFPSGHTQNIVGTAGAVGAFYRRRGVWIAAIVVSALIAFSRMYLGVHTPWDVLCSLAVAVLLVMLFEPVFRSEERTRRVMPILCAVGWLLSVAFLIFVRLQPAEAHESENLLSAMKNAAAMNGCAVALALVWFLDDRRIRFQTAAPWYAQILKLVIGFAVIIGIKTGLSAPLVALFGNEYVARAVRYFLIVLFAGAGWPCTFRWFAAMRVAPLDRFSARIGCLFCKAGKSVEKNEKEIQKE